MQIDTVLIPLRPAGVSLGFPALSLRRECAHEKQLRDVSSSLLCGPARWVLVTVLAPQRCLLCGLCLFYSVLPGDAITASSHFITPTCAQWRLFQIISEAF